MREIICFEPNSQKWTDPGRILCTQPVWRKFVRNTPLAYARLLASLSQTGANVQNMNDVTGQLWDFDVVNSLQACVFTMEKLSKKSDNWLEKLLWEIKVLRDDRLYSPPVRTYVSAIRCF